MSSGFQLCDADPHAPFRDSLGNSLQSACSLDAAIAFVTKGGVKFVLERFLQKASANELQTSRLCVSVHWPTDLDALCRLSPYLKDRLRLYLGPQTPQETRGHSPLMHSKVVLSEQSDGRLDIFVGSHNWTGAALDGVNFEASVHLLCDEASPFAASIRKHLDACSNDKDCVAFDPANLAYYKSLQKKLFPKIPESPPGVDVEGVLALPEWPAVVIHAEDSRERQNQEELLIYLPLFEDDHFDWFNPNRPTHVYLYLYPPDTLFGYQPPKADPSLYEGSVQTFGWVGRSPIGGQEVHCQINRLARPTLESLPDKNIPTPSGEQAQVVVYLKRYGKVKLPIYHQGGKPVIRTEAVFEGPMEDEVLLAGERDVEPTNATGDSAELVGYYTAESLVDGQFVFRRPHSQVMLQLNVPGQEFYREGIRQALASNLMMRRQYSDVVVDPGDDTTEGRYVYQVRYVLGAPDGTHLRIVVDRRDR